MHMIDIAVHIGPADQDGRIRQQFQLCTRVRSHLAGSKDRPVRLVLFKQNISQLRCHFFVLRLLGNSAFHSDLMDSVVERARAQLGDLGLRAPTVPLIDGRGVQWRPLTAGADDLRDYTLATQVTETFDFTAAVRVALREYAPERLVLLGPGESLGSAVAQVLIAERWQGIDSREAFLARQAAEPVVVSMARPEQAKQIV